MLSRKKKPRLTRQQSLAAKPVRLVETALEEEPGGGGKLKVPVRQTRWSGWLFSAPPGAVKIFEFDPIGIFVWNSCDGKTSVQQIIRTLAKRYNLNLREAEVPTVRFLHVLAKKGLVGLPMYDKIK